MQPRWFKIMGSDKVKNSAGRHGRFSTRVLRARPLPPLPPSGVAQEGAAPLPPAAGGLCHSPRVTGGLWVVFNSSVPRQPSWAACWAQRCCFPNPSPHPRGRHFLGMKVRVGSWLGEQSWSPPKRGEGRLSRASVSLVGALENGPKPSRGCNPVEKNL